MKRNYLFTKVIKSNISNVEKVIAGEKTYIYIVLLTDSTLYMFQILKVYHTRRSAINYIKINLKKLSKFEKLHYTKIEM